MNLTSFVDVWKSYLLAGVDNGSRLRVRSEGNSGKRGGPPGDLFVFIQVRSHPKLRREGTTIHVEVQITYVDAILGSSVQVESSPVEQSQHHKTECVISQSGLLKRLRCFACEWALAALQKRTSFS